MSLLATRPRRSYPRPVSQEASSGESREVSWATAEAEVMPLLGDRGRAMLEKWRRDRPRAVDSLQGFVHRRIFEVHPREVEPLLNPPMEEWPFRPGTRKEEWRIKAVDDMTGGEPLVLAMHRFVESNGRAPSWSDVCGWMMEPEILPTFVRPAWDMYNALPDHEQPSRTRWQMAIMWRIGNAYLSFLRELDFLSRMIHDHRIPLRIHIVVDSVLKVDFWFGASAVCLYLPNSFRERKASPTLVRGQVHEICLSEKLKVWNAVARVSDSDLASLAASIRKDAEAWS